MEINILLHFLVVMTNLLFDAHYNETAMENFLDEG